MEGDTGAGGASHRVAAILQGLEESGVVLTMVGSQRDNQYRRNFSTSKPTLAAVKPVVLERCSVETNTDFSVSNNSNRGVQISDDRYTSCYQVAHCSVRPSSPPVTVSEFPPQRSSPSYFDGNFEVGGSGSCDRRESYSRSIRIRRLTTPDRSKESLKFFIADHGSVNRIPSRDAEAFAHSLRKYPSFPVLRTVSSEIVAKLQRSFRKHAILSTNRTPSGELVERILRQTQEKLAPVQKVNSIRSLQKERSRWKQPRHTQAHAKTQDVLDNRRVDRPRTGRKEDESKARKHMRSDDSHRLNRRKCKSHTESLLNTTYDYLKSTQPSRSCHARRFDRDPRIDEISKHVRSALREIYNQRSVVFPMCSKVQRRYDDHKKHCSGRGVDARNISKLSNSSEEQLFSNRNKASQYFHNDAGCRCGSDPTDPNRVDSTCNCSPTYGEEYSRYNIQEEIHAWLSEIPVRSNEDTEDKLRREDLVRNLVTTLERLLYDDNFEENVINAVTECVDAMPMWNFGSRQKKDQLKEHLKQNLLDRLIPKPESKLSETVKKILVNVNFKHEVDTKRISDDLTDALHSLTVFESNDQHKFNIFVSEIYKILEKLPIKVNGDKGEYLNNLARNLANEMIEVLKDTSDSSKSDAKYSMSNRKHMLHNCSLMGPCKRAELRPFYNRKRSSQYGCDSDTCEYKSQNTNKRQLCDCCPKSKRNVNCVCIAEVKRTSHPCDCESEEVYFNECVDEEIDDWLNQIPVPINESEVDTMIRKHVAKHLAEALKQLPDDNNFKGHAQEVIERWINNVSIWQPDTEHEKIKLKRLVTESLLDRIITIPRRPDKLTVIVKKFIGSIDLGDSNVNRKELTNNLTKRLKYLTVTPEDSDKYRDLLISEVTEIFKYSLPQTSNAESEYLHKLATKLVEEIINSESYVDIYAEDTTSLKEDIIKNLFDWIDEVTELSETPPNMREAKRVIDELAIKLVDLQSIGTDTSTMKKMGNEIQSSLKKLNISTKAMDNLIENVIDTITDTTYAKDKVKLETNHRREVLRDLNDWLKDKEEVSNLNPQEQYSVVKEIVDKIEKAKAEGHEDHQDIILESLAQNGYYMDPDVHLDEFVKKWKTFSARHKEKDLKDKIQKSVYPVIDKLNVSEDNKIYIKDRLGKELDNNITESSIATRKGIENINEALLEKMDEIVEELHLPKNIKDQLNETINKNIEQLMTSKSRDAIIQALTKEINYIISNEEIPESEKKHLKLRLKQMLNEYSGIPFSNYVTDNIFESIDQIINEEPIESTVKEGLINKLIYIAQNKFNELPTQTVKNHVTEKALKDIDLTIESAPLKENVKNDLKQMLKYILNENLKQPFSAEVKESTLEQFHETLNDLLIPDVTRNDLLKKITNIVSQNLDELQCQTEIDHAKEMIMNDLNDLIDHFFLPKGQATQLNDGLRRLLAEYLDRPYSNDLKEKLTAAINKVITETPMDFDKKEELKLKVIDTINKRLDNLTYQSAEEFAKESILKDIMRMLNETSLPNSEKHDIRHKFELIIEDCFPLEHLDAAKNVMGEGIRQTIYESSIPQSKQNELVDKMIDITDKILDESFYDDRVREHLHGMYSMIENQTPLPESHKDILKNELKAALDKYLQDPELLDIIDDSPSYDQIDQQEIDEANYDKIIKDAMDVIEETPISINKKHTLENKLKNMVFDANRPKNFKQVLKDLYKSIEELSIPWHHKKALKSKLADIVPKNLQINQLKHTLLKDIDSAIDLEPLDEEQKSNLKSKFSEFVDLLEPFSDKVDIKVKDDMIRIIDENVLSRDQKRNLKDRIENIVTKISTKGQDEQVVKEKIMKYITEVIDEAPIRHHLKRNILYQLKRAISENFEQPLTRDTAVRLKNNFVNIIDEVPITDYQRDSLKRRLNDILTRQLEQLPMNRDDVRYLLLSDIDKILEDKSIPKTNKTDLLQKIRKAVFTNTDEPLSDGIKSKIQQKIADTVDEAIIPKEKKNKLKEEIDAVVRKNFAMVSSNLKPADNLSNSLVRNICNVIKDAPISHENKKYLKKKIEESLPSRLQGVTSNDLEETVNNEMLNIINEVAVSPAQKKILKNFLANIVSQVIQEHQSKALKDEIKQNTLRDVNIVIEKLNLPKERKKQIKFKLKDLIDENFEKPLTVENSKVIKKGIYDIVAEAPLTKEKKAEIRHNLANIVDNNVKSFISVSSKPGTLMKSTKKPKRTLLNGIDLVLDPLPINVDDKLYIKQMLESVADEISGQPAEVIKDTIKIILDDTSIPKNKKAEVLEKLHYKIVDNLNTPYDKQMSLKTENILWGIDPHLDELQVSSAQKKYLKNKFEDVIAEHLNESVSSNTMRVIKDNIYNIISEMPLSNNQKNLLSSKLIDLVKSNNTRDVRKPSTTQQVMISLPKRIPAVVYLSPVKKTSAIQEIDTVLDHLQMPTEHKRNLKPILKKLVQETLDAPLTSDTYEIIKKGISEIMVDAPIYPRDKKSEIKSKLHDMVDNIIKPMIESSTGGTLRTSAGTSTANNLARNVYISPTKKNNAMRDLDAVFNQLQVSSAEKNDLKSKVKIAINEIFETPLSVDTSPIIKDKIKIIIAESSNISSDKKNMLKNKLIDMVDSKIAPLIESDSIEPLSSMGERKRILSQELDHVLDKLQISNDEKKRVKSAVANISQPVNADIGDNLNAIVDDMTLPTNEKTELKNKLNNLVKTTTSNTGKGSASKNFNGKLCSSSRKDIVMALKPTNENLIVTLNSTIDHLDTSKHLKSVLKDVVHKTISKGDSLNSMITGRLKSAIAKAITDAPISKDKKNNIESALVNVIDEHVDDAPLTPTNEKIFNIKGTVLEDIESSLNSAQIPMDVKSNLKDKIRNKMVEYLETPQSTKKLENVQKDINNIINEAAILENVKTQLRNNIRNKINRNTEYLPVTEALSFYNPSKTTAMRYEDGSNITKAWPSHSKCQQDSLPSGLIYDADDEDTKDQMSVAMSVLKAPKDHSSKKKKLKENMLRDFSGIIDVVNIPRNKKTDLKIKLNGIVNSKIDKLFASPKRNSTEMKKLIADNIEQVIDEASMGPAVTRQMKNDLKDQLLKVANKNINTTITEGNKSTGQSQMLLGTIERLPIPSHIKDELKDKIMKSPEESVSSSQESRRLSPTRPRGSNISVIPEEGPVTSTPKKGRKSWERPINSFSVIANEDIMQSLSPEERDYWMQIEESISKWLDELPIDLDEDTKAAIKREIANDITDRLQYLQFNPGAKKSLQEELENLQYQVFRRLGKVLNREEMQLAIQAGDKLMLMMKDIKEPDEDAALERTAEFEFHQQIKDIISTTLPELENASTETLNSFEIMKDELADAFIKLHYTGGNEEELNKLKKKINDEIDKFCDDYLKKYPNKPLDREQLKRDLYNALKNVQPSDDLMKSAVEHVRFKDVVHEWVKKLPLKKQTTAERIKMNKNIAVLAKKLLDLEQNDELSDSEVKDKMATEIAKFLTTLPFKSGQEKNADKFKNDLIVQINKTKATRTFDASTRHSITLDDFLGQSSHWQPLFPPCTLSSEDLEHLARIKKRTCLAPDCLASLMNKASENKRNASVNPMSIESGAQTEHYSENISMPQRMQPCSSSYGPTVCPGQPLPYDQFCPMQFAGSPCTQSLSHMDVQPQIIIKEYYWNSTNTSEFPKSESRLSGGVQKRTCFASRPTPRCTQKYSQTSQDKTLGSISCTPSPCAPAPCSPTPCTPRFYTPKHCTTSALPQYFIPCHRINQQNSFPDDNGPRKDDQYTEYSEAQITKSVRKEHVIELGSLDELRKPSRKERRLEEFTSYSRNPEQTVCEESRSSPDDSDEAEICINRGQPKERTVTCKCKAKPAATGTRGRWKQETHRDRAILASNDSTAMKRCLKCCGMHCPYPSFMYFRQ
ncbi:unnamed protein product [Arctia plantaginis]|uniref:Uncharacterized protein n=1 Tax=Arctia plantaginis TaxID=874455 RepID=A0A8S0ZUY8_ARCPL|nr:unnamed protein product [Arctia plantaginis]